MKLVKTITNYFLAINLLIATTGVVVNKHYCMGRLKSVAINQSASPCNDENGEPLSMPCCEDVSQELKVKEITQVTFDFDSRITPFQLACTPVFIFDDPHRENEGQRLNVDYSPPPLELDAQVEFQAFLI